MGHILLFLFNENLDNFQVQDESEIKQTTFKWSIRENFQDKIKMEQTLFRWPIRE